VTQYGLVEAGPTSSVADGAAIMAVAKPAEQGVRRIPSHHNPCYGPMRRMKKAGLCSVPWWN
jgi:hypothetical protein